MIFAGIDAGSRVIKVVLWEATEGRIVGQGTAAQGVAQERLARELFEALLAKHDLQAGQIGGVVATGYGRNLIPFADTTITEITCHAQGVRQRAPDARTIVEMGGQDSKLIRLDPHGAVRDFAMNDRCAAGTGRFLEVMATQLGLGWADLGDLIRTSRQPAIISSTCVVFAETEIIGLLAQGVVPADIGAGVLAAMASRVATMAGRQVEKPVYFTGGVALVPGMAAALAQALDCPVTVVDQPMMTGALGAACLAARRRVGG